MKSVCTDKLNWIFFTLQFLLDLRMIRTEFKMFDANVGSDLIYFERFIAKRTNLLLDLRMIRIEFQMFCANVVFDLNFSKHFITKRTNLLKGIHCKTTVNKESFYRRVHRGVCEYIRVNKRSNANDDIQYGEIR